MLREDEKSSKASKERPHLLKVVAIIKAARQPRIAVEILERLLQHRIHFHYSNHITNQKPQKSDLFSYSSEMPPLCPYSEVMTNAKGGSKATGHLKTPSVALPSMS